MCLHKFGRHPLESIFGNNRTQIKYQTKLVN